ncbi:LamG-like jellyroll fold domain-containing protein, partial [Desulforamulus aeronauticus]
NTTNWGIWFSNASGEGSIVNLGSITTAGWYTFGITWDANTGGQGYLNGVNKGSVATRFLPTTISAPVAYIGSWTSGNQYNQLIDDLRISNRARTAAEIQGAFQSNQPLPVDADTTLKVTFDNSLDANIPAINYIYDSLNRLNMVVTPNKAINLQYDNNGNLIRRTINYQGN